jgi:insulysin
MDALIELACQHFSLIPNRNLGPPPLITESPWSATTKPVRLIQKPEFELTTKQKIVFVETVKDIQRIEVNFPIPYQAPLYKSKPSHYASHLIGHEGPGSAFHLLHQRGLATALSCGLHAAGRGFSLFHIDVSLTKAGLGLWFISTCLRAVTYYLARTILSDIIGYISLYFIGAKCATGASSL